MVSRLVVAVAFCGLQFLASAADAGIWIRRTPPLDFAEACQVVLPSSCSRTSIVALAPPFAYADVGGSVDDDPARIAAHGGPVDVHAAVGLAFVARAGSLLDVEADVDVRRAGDAEVCLVVGFEAVDCVTGDGPQVLEATVAVPDGATLVADPRVYVRLGQEPGAAVVLVASISYRTRAG